MPAEKTFLVLAAPPLLALAFLQRSFSCVFHVCVSFVHVAPAFSLTVHRLAARTVIRSLEMQQREHRGEQNKGVKEKVVELSVQSGVSSVFTAFIAVNKEDGKAITGPLLRRSVPAPGA